MLSSFLLLPFSLVPCFTLTSLSPFSHQQELVNLLLTGKAVSNVFNDVVELDSGNGNITLLKGISTRSDIGFLSLFEHYNVCQVPSERSAPRRPRSPAPGDLQEGGRRRRARLQVPGAGSSLNHRGSRKSAASLPSRVHTHSQQTPGKGLQGICSVTVRQNGYSCRVCLCWLGGLLQ